MLIAGGVFLCIIGVIGAVIFCIGLAEEEPGLAVAAVVVAACGITFGVINFVNYGDPPPPKLKVERGEDYFVVTAGEQSVQLNCPRTLPQSTAPESTSAAEIEDPEARAFEEWSEAHHR